MQHKANSDQVMVMGFSQGAMLAHALLLHARIPLAGIAGFSGRLVPELISNESEARSKENIVEFGLLDNDYSGEPTLQSSDAFIPFDLLDNSILLVKGSKLVKPK